jgi:hypothetical protein
MIPQKDIKAATDGIREALDHRVIDGRPMTDIIVPIIGGSSVQSASNVLTSLEYVATLPFKMAGIFSIKDAIMKAEPMEIE